MKYDKGIEIAIGKSRKEVNWKSAEMMWSDFVDRISKTTRTYETVKEFAKLPKSKQDEIKDVGGFVGGTLINGKRKHESLLNRCLLALDIDFGDIGIWDIYELLYGNAAVMYSTHKHAPENPRLRLIIPLNRQIQREEYEPVCRMIASDLGIDKFDDTTFEPSRLMYWPSTPKDGEYIFKVCDSEWLNPDDILKRYQNWNDISSWPRSERVSKIIQREIKKQGDPLEKPGLIGAFCRTYSIQEAIEKFLMDEYEPCEGGRYTYKFGSTSAGLVIYEDKFAYSHHGTDPISQKLCNAFDLVRLHKFGLRDEDAKEGAASNRLPSFTAMTEFCTNDENTKLNMAREKIAEAQADFEYYNEDEASENDDSWKSDLDVDSKGRIKSTCKNIVTILENDPRLKDKISLNEFEHREVMLGKLPWRKKEDTNIYLTDVDDSELRIYLEIIYHISGKNKIDDAVKKATYANSFHPVKEYFRKIPTWDKADRISTYYIDYLGVKDTEYARAVSRKSFVACVARIFEPGCKFDHILVLVGGQGVGKSTSIMKIARQWFSDSLDAVTGKDAYEQLQGAWIVELGELASLKKAEIEQIKHFITKAEDRYRVAYGRRVENFPRQCVFFGTTNNKDFLKDPTGNRRFWPLDTMEQNPTKNIFKDLTAYEIDQMWAEAYHYYQQGEPIFLSEELEAQAIKQQESHTEENEKKGLIEDYLELDLPVSWDNMDTLDRQNYIHNRDYRGNLLKENQETHKRMRVCAAEIWCELFKGFLKEMDRNNTKEIHDVMRKMDGWIGHRAGKARFKMYGVQRAYVRSEKKIT